MNELIALDHALFQLINGTWHNGFLDALFPFLRNKYFWMPLYLFLLSFLVINYKKQGVIVAVFAILVITLGDQLSSQVIKELVERLRPCKNPQLAETVRLLVPCGSGKSFTSSHAVNHFAAAAYFGSLFFARFRWVLPLAVFWAALVSYGQVYVGLHFPADVLAGGILGCAIGFVVAFFARRNIKPNHGFP